MSRQDPLERRADEETDLYEIATWEPRSWLDRLSVRLHAAVLAAIRAIIVGLAILVLVAQLVLGGLAAVVDPLLGSLVILSIVPALGIAVYIWYADVTTREPLSLLLATFLLGVLFAGFAAVVNSVGSLGLFSAAQYLSSQGPQVGGLWSFVAMVTFFFLVVGPVEEATKLLAVRLYAYRSGRFDAVIDGAVYGAVAGLGFATIENAIYILQGFGAAPVAPSGQIAAVRALAGPGHVLYSAIAGFYLGLARFNPAHRGPLVVKGLLIAAVFHALYNILVGPASALLAAAVAPVTEPVGFLTFVLVYLSIVGAFLHRKLAAYRHAFRNGGQVRSAE